MKHYPKRTDYYDAWAKRHKSRASQKIEELRKDMAAKNIEDMEKIDKQVELGASCLVCLAIFLITPISLILLGFIAAMFVGKK